VAEKCSWPLGKDGIKSGAENAWDKDQRDPQPFSYQVTKDRRWEGKRRRRNRVGGCVTKKIVG